ncbi:MAG: hypothetical protein NUW23_10880 [Firmicutes bacterium]|jgi:hypothetical protein|nr:hypothetical protein [Bacillota bacterium]
MAGFFVFMVAMALMQVPRLVHARDWRGLAAFGGVWVVAAVYGGLFFGGVPLPRAGAIIVSIFDRLVK